MIDYRTTGDILVSRIEALIPAHPAILTMTNPFDLFKIKDFKVKDIEPSLMQAGFALRKARENYKKRTPPTGGAAGRDLILE